MTPPRPSGSAAGLREEASPWALDYAETPEDLFEPGSGDRVRVHLLTDPWSVWCWGFEPVARTITHRYPSIEFRHVLGGMFEHLPDPETHGFDLDRFFATVNRTTGMPTTTHGLDEDRPASTYPACIHVHAMRLLQPDREEAYLRAMREAAYLDGLNISDRDVAARVAERVGVEAEAFREALASGEPEREFRHRLEVLEQQDLHGYPTLIVTAGEETAQIRGFQPLPSVLAIAESVSGRLHPSAPAPEPEELIAPEERVATREIAEVLDTSVEQAADRLTQLADDGVLERDRHPQGDVWSKPD